MSSESKPIKEFILEQIYKIHTKILPQDREYCELGKKHAEILQRLIVNFTPEEHEILNGYDEVQTLQMNRQDEIIYSRGLLDGIRVAYWVDLARREPEKFLSEIGIKAE